MSSPWTGTPRVTSQSCATAEFGPPPPPPGVADRIDRGSLPSIFTVLQERLGLKLDAQRGPVRVFAIDRLERPVEP